LTDVGVGSSAVFLIIVFLLINGVDDGFDGVFPDAPPTVYRGEGAHDISDRINAISSPTFLSSKTPPALNLNFSMLIRKLSL